MVCKTDFTKKHSFKKIADSSYKSTCNLRSFKHRVGLGVTRTLIKG